MRGSAEADVIFRILTLTLTCIRFMLLLLLLVLLLNLTLTIIQFLLLLGMQSPREYDLKWSFLRIWRKRDLEDVQEEDFLLPHVQKCFAQS